MSLEPFKTERRQVADLPAPKTLCVGADCCGCHTTLWIPIPKVNGDPPPEFAARLFREKDWEVGRKRRWDRCPRCQGHVARPTLDKRARGVIEANLRVMLRVSGRNSVVSTARVIELLRVTEVIGLATTDAVASKALQPVMDELGFTGPKGISYEGRSCNGYGRPISFDPTNLIKSETPMNAHTPTPPAGDPATRQPTRLDIRRIMEALDAKYDLEGERYRGKATDAMLAQELDVPRAWVSAERERAYGPERNEEARQLVERADAILADAEALDRRLEAALAEVQAVLDAAKALSARVAPLRGK